jgi:hypothetical protein
LDKCINPKIATVPARRFCTWLRLRKNLDQFQLEAVSDLADRIEIGRLAEHIYWQDRL